MGKGYYFLVQICLILMRFMMTHAKFFDPLACGAYCKKKKKIGRKNATIW